MRYATTPWARAAMDDDALHHLAELNDVADSAFLSLLASSVKGPYTGRLFIPERPEIRVEAGTMAGVFRALIERVAA